MTAPTGRRTVDGALTDDVTEAARAAWEAGRRVDHDAGIRQARTAMVATRAGLRWGWSRRGAAGEAVDRAADAVLTVVAHPDPGLLEDIAYATSRTYDEVLARWHHHHPDPEPPAD